MTVVEKYRGQWIPAKLRRYLVPIVSKVPAL